MVLMGLFLILSLAPASAVQAKDVLASWDEKPVKKKNLGVAKLTIRNWGEVSSDEAGYNNNQVKLVNTTRFNFDGKKFDISASCTAKVGAKYKVCYDALSGKLSGDKGGVSCSVKGKVKIGVPKLKAKICTTVELTGKVGSKPHGSLRMDVKVKPGGIDKTLMKVNL